MLTGNNLILYDLFIFYLILHELCELFKTVFLNLFNSKAPPIIQNNLLFFQKLKNKQEQ